MAMIDLTIPEKKPRSKFKKGHRVYYVTNPFLMGSNVRTGIIKSVSVPEGKEPLYRVVNDNTHKGEYVSQSFLDVDPDKLLEKYGKMYEKIKNRFPRCTFHIEEEIK